MNIPKNYITALPKYQFQTDLIDELLPFKSKYVFIIDIGRTPKGYGRWELSVTLKINDDTVKLRAHTTDAHLIDEWYIDDREINQDTMSKAVEIVLAANEDKLEDII